MNADIRLSVGFFDHPKTIKLQRRVGHEGVLCLLRLWAFAAKHRCSGVLLEMDEEDVAIAAGWLNDHSTFVATLVEIRWLDVENGVYSLHDWGDHQSRPPGWSPIEAIEKEKFRRSGPYKKWRLRVLARDNYTCQRCGGAGSHAHHIQSFCENIDLRLIVDNGLTMCPECHRAYHYGGANEL